MFFCVATQRGRRIAMARGVVDEKDPWKAHLSSPTTPLQKVQACIYHCTLMSSTSQNRSQEHQGN